MHACIHRAELDPAYKTCSAGKEQSPIDFQFLDLKKSQLPQIGWYFLFFHFFILFYVCQFLDLKKPPLPSIGREKF
jgi:hypothetical protein